MTEFKSGDRVITTAVGEFHEVGKHGIVNNDRGKYLGVTVSENGKGSLFDKDKCRIATPADPGYHGTYTEFAEEIAELKTKVHNARVYAVMSLTVTVALAVLLYFVAS